LRLSIHQRYLAKNVKRILQYLKYLAVISYLEEKCIAVKFHCVPDIQYEARNQKEYRLRPQKNVKRRPQAACVFYVAP
jgi:hypothetical protein